MVSIRRMGSRRFAIVSSLNYHDLTYDRNGEKMRKGDKFTPEAVMSASKVPASQSAKAVGHRLKQLQRYLDMTQTDLGKRIGVQQSKISKYQSGQTMLPVEEGLALCRACAKHDVRPTRLTIRWLYEGLGDELHREFKSWLHASG